MPDYNTLQMSSDAKDFASTLGDDEGRALTANICDMVFALSYGVLGVVAFNKLASGRVALLGTLLAVGASLADEIENVLVFLNIKSDSLTNGDVDLMGTFGLDQVGAHRCRHPAADRRRRTRALAQGVVALGCIRGHCLLADLGAGIWHLGLPGRHLRQEGLAMAGRRRRTDVIGRSSA